MPLPVSRRVLLCLGLVIATAPGVRADDVLHYDQVDLAADAEQQVDNDLLIATLYTEHEGRRQAEIATRVNDTMSWALAQVKQVRDVKAQTAQYSTYPVYANNGTTVTGWRARQAVRLEGRDAQKLGDLVGTLQEKLAVESIGFGVSRERRDAAESALTAEALAKFQARAQQVAAALGRTGYRVVRLNIGTAGHGPAPIMRHEAMMMATKDAASPAQFEAGTRAIGVTVAGTIQLDAR
ncbi:MAG: SIMPL domain-containing protein [Gammaproteobacteria bacterium]